jgi:hypothetical protein
MQVAVSLGLRHQARSEPPKAASKATASVPIATATLATKFQKRKSASDMAELISVNGSIRPQPLRVSLA